MARGAKFKKHEAGEEDSELNLAPIIDCFTVIITYLLFTVSFISLAEMDVSAVTSGKAGESTSPAVTIALGLTEGKTLQIQVHGSENLSVDLPAKNGDWDLQLLEQKLGELKVKWPQTDSLALGAGDEIRYQELVKVLESARKVYPRVGFTELRSAS